MDERAAAFIHGGKAMATRQPQTAEALVRKVMRQLTRSFRLHAEEWLRNDVIPSAVFALKQGHFVTHRKRLADRLGSAINVALWQVGDSEYVAAERAKHEASEGLPDARASVLYLHT